MIDGVKTDYLSSVFDPSKFGRTVKRAIELGRKALKNERFDAIAFTGNSGAALSYILAAELGVALICLRKKTDNSHYMNSCGRLEGYLNAERYLFVDDFITSGDTYKGLVTFLKERMPKAECVGALLYADHMGRQSYLGLPVYSNCRHAPEEQVSFRDIIKMKDPYGDNAYRW